MLLAERLPFAVLGLVFLLHASLEQFFLAFAPVFHHHRYQQPSCLFLSQKVLPERKRELLWQGEHQ